jgi:hypothetical protein
MDARHFDQLTGVLGRRTRRSLAALLAGAASVHLLDAPASKASNQERRRRRMEQNWGCKPSCNGCGGSDGCGGTCGCGENQICEGGVCRTCDVTCNGDAAACGQALNE